MEEMTVVVSVEELKGLLYSIAAQEVSVGIRYRPIDQLWHPNFLQLLSIADGKSVLFVDKTRNQFIRLADLATIIQFELDDYLHPFEPNLHYHVLFPEN